MRPKWDLIETCIFPFTQLLVKTTYSGISAENRRLFVFYRNIGLGTSSAAGRVGAITSPFVIWLVRWKLELFVSSLICVATRCSRFLIL